MGLVNDLEDEKYMDMALKLAALAMGRTSPNPMVGAVIVRDGVVVSKGYHVRAGAPHAEVVALREAGEMARGATLYVNLEPCCHYGRTGPCTEAILAAGVKKVVVAMVDPNPLVAGKGIARLRAAGVEVRVGVLEERARKLNEVFIKYITSKKPFLVLKVAMSLDGKIATSTGDSKWITGTESRTYVHRLRDRYDAVMVGVGTVLADDPMLTVRLPDGSGRDPIRIVVDSLARTPPTSKLLLQGSSAPTIIAVTEHAPPERLAALERAGAEVLVVPGPERRVNLEKLMEELGRREVTGILVEGGAELNGSLVAAGLVDKVIWFVAPRIIGGRDAPGPVGGAGFKRLADALSLEDVEVRRYGDDVCIEGYVVRRGE